MEDLLPKQTFSARHEFVGNLSKYGVVADKLHIVLQYSLIKEGEIVGKVLGTEEAYHKLMRLSNPPGPYLKLTSEKTEHITDHISSEKVLLKTTIHRSWSLGYGEKMTYVVSDLSFQDITITEYCGPNNSLERHLTFFLTGPRRLWGIYLIKRSSFTGETKIEVHNSKIELNEDLPFEIEVSPWHFHDKTPAANNYELTTDVLVLNFKTIEPVEKLSDENFMNQAKALADDLTLLVSFLSGRWITWYRYQLVTNDAIESYVRKTRECSTNEPDWDDSLVELSKSREFLKVGLSNLRKLRSEGFDLFMPIVYFVSGNEAKYVQEKFAIFFLSLEKIKDLFALKKGFAKNLSDKDFRNLRSLMSDVIEKNVKPSELRERIQTKIPELNRPSLRFILESLFLEYNVDWKDIYPPGSDFALIKTRDELFHSSQEIDIAKLAKEVHRLRAVVARLLLRMLGWEDVSQSPTVFIREWLTTVKNDAN